MNVSYTLPLESAWRRMVRMLFRPARIDFWLTLGFAAFLSEYLSHLASGGGRFTWKEHAHGPIGDLGRDLASFLMNPVWGTLAVVVAVSATLAVLAAMWASSRGKFVFLDGVMRERAAIVEPWRTHARRGNALFGFWLISSLAFLLLVCLISLPLLPSILGAIAGGGWRVLGLMTIAGWAAVMIPLAILWGLTHLMLFQFVVPIMARDDLGVMAAWGRFLGLFRRHPMEFIAYAVVFVVLKVAVIAVLAVVGLSTCCVGFLLFWVPYVGSVVLLPAEVLFRGLGPDFLAQFGPEWSLAPLAPAAPAAPGAGA